MGYRYGVVQIYIFPATGKTPRSGGRLYHDQVERTPFSPSGVFALEREKG
jgi:hypothetical protein